MTLFPEDQSIMYVTFISSSVDCFRFFNRLLRWSVIIWSLSDKLAAFIDIHYFVVMLFVLSYDPYRHDESMDYTSIFKRCGTEQVISEDTLVCISLSIWVLAIWYQRTSRNDSQIFICLWQFAHSLYDLVLWGYHISPTLWNHWTCSQ